MSKDKGWEKGDQHTLEQVIGLKAVKAWDS